MKTTRMFLLMFCAVCAAMSASAEPEPQQSGAPADGVVMATQRSDGSTNTWTLAELQDALGLMNRKYWRDMKTAQGRREWHGSAAARTCPAASRPPSRSVSDRESDSPRSGCRSVLSWSPILSALCSRS